MRINSLSGEDEHKWTVIIAVALTMSLRRAKNRNFALASVNCGRALSELIIVENDNCTFDSSNCNQT